MSQPGYPIAQAASVDFKATGFFFFYAGCSLSVHWWEQLFKLLLLVLFLHKCKQTIID